MGTMSNVDHRSSQTSAFSGAVGEQVDLRPVIVAIRELSGAIAGKEAEDRTIVVPAPTVTMPEILNQPQIKVEVQPTPVPVEIKLPTQEALPPPVVNVAFPVMPIIFIGICNIITTAAILVYLALK